jgi:hypothetical protein
LFSEKRIQLKISADIEDDGLLDEDVYKEEKAKSDTDIKGVERLLHGHRAEHPGLEPVRRYNCPIPESSFQSNFIKNGTNGTL